MKAIKKLTAILLSVMMLLGLVIIPSSAEDVAADTLVTKEYSLFDLSGATVGASTVDDAEALPEGVAEGGIERFNTYPSGYSAATFYSGTQSVVNVDGQNMLKVVFDKMSSQGGNDLYGAKGLYSIKTKIPEGLGSYVTNVTVEFKDHGKLGGNLRYRIGVMSDGMAATPGYGVKYYGTDVGGETYTVADFDVFADFEKATAKWAANQTTGKLDVATNTPEEVFLVFSSEAAKEDGGTGYVLLKDIRVTVTAPQAIHDDPIITKTVNLLDFSDYALGEIEAADYPDGVAEYAFPGATNTFTGKGGKKYVAEHNGKKVLQLDLNTVTDGFATPTANNIRLIQEKYDPIYYIKLTNIPAEIIPYISNVNIKMYKETDWKTGIVHEFGLSDGTNYSRLSASGNLNYYQQGYWEKSYAISSFKKGNQWYHQGYSDGNFASKESWGNTFNTLFLALSANVNANQEDAGRLNIEEISYTFSAPKSVVDSLPITKKVNLLDMSHAAEGTITDADYPIGVAEYKLGGNKFTDLGGVKKVVTNAKGNKVLQLDMGSIVSGKTKSDGTAVTGNELKWLGNSYNYEGSYYIKLTNIPSSYLPYISKIGVKMKKTSDTQMLVYELGVSDGTSYSKATRSNYNCIVDASNTATVKYEVEPSKLVKTPNIWGTIGYKADLANWGTWDNTYNTIFLALAATNETIELNKFTLDIEEIYYTVTATEEQLATADAEWAEQKYLVNDFENDAGTETEFAAGGSKAYKLDFDKTTKTINVTNPYLRTAKGISFWAYNFSDKATYPLIGVNLSDGTRYLDGTTQINPGEYKRIELDFDALGLDLIPTANDSASKKGPDQSLTTAQRASITSLHFARYNVVQLYIDDIYLITDENYKKREASNIAINADTVTGATVNEEGKIVIPASAEDQTVAITVPEGSLTNASTLTYKFTSNASADAQLRFYTDAVFDATRKTNGGEAAYIRFGNDPWRTNHAVKVGETYTHTANFYGNSDGGNCVSIIPTGNEDKFKWPGANSVYPTASEKAKTTTIYVDVKAFGDPTNADDYITLDSIALLSEGVRISTVTSAGGKVTLPTSRRFPGSTADFFIKTYTDCYLREIVVTDSTGASVPITKSKILGGKNLGAAYSFTTPVADVTITPRFSIITETFTTTTAYDGDNFSLNFTTPIVDTKGYNQLTGNFENVESCGVIVAPKAALTKYGFTRNDLTPENVAAWKESGHHIAKYIVALDNAEIVLTEETESIDFNIDFTNVSLDARRNWNTCIVSYASFTDDEGNDTGTKVTRNENTLDAFVYGDGLVEEFDITELKGINYCGSGASSNFDEMKAVNDKGFEFVRLPLYAYLNEGQLDESKLAGYDKKVANAISLGMPAIVDLHGLYEVIDGANVRVDLNGNFDANVEKVYAAWEVLANRYAKYPLSVAFEIINEPRTTGVEGEDPMDVARLMEMQTNIIEYIRAIPGNEDRTVIIGSDVNYPLNMEDDFVTNGNGILDYDNIMIDFHCYTPMEFTHSGVGDDVAGITQEEAGVNYENLQAIIESIVAFGDEYGVGVFMGEWGAYEPDYEDKLEYYTNMVTYMADAGLAWSVWGYTEPYSGYVNGVWDENLLDIYFS